jgi:uncharacterized protein (DUF488 family)
MTRPLYTIGHSTRPIEEFVGLLTNAGVERLVDVRSIPRSRAVPQFNGDVLPASLEAAGIEYRHLAALGGRRHHRKGAPPSANTYWRVAAFRDYADYAESAEFRAGLDLLLEWSTGQTCAIMCAEAVWWRCHRRIIADYALSRGRTVMHIIGAGNVSAATLTPGAQVMADGTIRYLADAQSISAGD